MGKAQKKNSKNRHPHLLQMMKLLNLMGLLLFSFVLAGCSKDKIIEVRPKYSGDHTTAQIRGMWLICYQTRSNNIPYLPPPMHMEHCDCVVDKSRENHSSEDYIKIGSDNLTIFFTKVSIECDNTTLVKPEPTAI